MMLLKICKVPVCCCLLFISLFAAAQTRDRIYIQSDRSGYVAGETIWLKAYLFSAFSPGSLGTNLLIDMVDESGKRILAGSLPVMGGTASGNIDLPLRIAQGIYFIRAYTKAQPSNTDYSFAVKPVYVFNPSIVKSTQILAPVSDYQCSFRPSSGNLVVGLVNLVYVSAYDLSGRPAVVEGTIVNTKNEESDVFKTDNNGKGKFAISPLPGEQYMARIRFADGTLKTYNLPKPDQNKVLIGISDLPKAKLFNVLIPEALRTGAMMHLRGFMDNNIVFEKNFSASVDHVSARIPVDELPSGLLQLVVTDSKKQKLGEANTFVLADSSIMSLQFHADTLNLSPGGKNVFSFVLPEDITGSFSVAITDYDKTLYTDENNIITGLLLNQDSHNNSFVSNSAIFNVAKKADLDMALGSTDWLDQSLYAGTNSVINDSDFIAIRGKIFNKGNRKPLTKGDITFMYTTKDSVTSMLTSPMAKDGSFSLRQLIFEGKQVFRYSVNGNKWDEIDMSLDTTKPEDVLRLPFNRSGMMVDRTVFADERKTKQATETYTAYLADSISSTGLKAVIVTARKISPKQQVNDRYARGLFTGMAAAKVLDLINEPPLSGGNILDYLQGQIPGLMITAGGGQYSIQSNRMISLRLMPPIRLFLDESPITIDFLTFILAKDVALVKYYPPGMGGALPGVGIGAALVIYTKKITDGGSANFGGMNQFTYFGYLPAKDFTNDFLSKNESSVSRRSTLYWNPNLIAEEGKPVYKLRFTNSDTAKKLYVVVEGFTIDGKLVHFEKVVE